MKIILIILLILNTSVSYGQIKFDNLSGQYEYFRETLIGYDHCCRVIWNLELKEDSTFYIDFKDDQGDYEIYTYSYGIYTVKADILYMYSKVPKDLSILRERYNNLQDSLFKISFRNNGLNNIKFYSLNNKYERKLIQPKYIISDKTDGFSINYDNDTKPNFDYKEYKTISYIFLKSDIEDFLLSKKKGRYGKVSECVLIKIDDFSHNDFYIGKPKSVDYDRFNSKKFVDVSAYRFKIKTDEIISIDKYSKGVGELTFVTLKKKK